MKCIPGGEFIRGSNRVSIEEDTGKKIKDEAPIMKITLSTFFMDTNEVTYSDYQKCVKAGGCSKAGPHYRGYSNSNQPMLGLNWYQARDYCKWKGKRLPTESEWEKAARGTEGEEFPWGNDPITCEKAIIQEKGQKGCGLGTTHDVASRPAFRYGLYDMAGNSWEWVNDWYSEDYETCGENCKKKDPQGPCEGVDDCPGYNKKIVRGGSWWWDGEFALGSNRRSHFPSNSPYHHFGFRCAKMFFLK
ncbi:MAG: formylglycine-generating enzyme family protein [Leptospiraceae bacterium]|nr:formylglycine-generating enzyme family protein [Leptospiraceae bacterium]MCP5496161.1 formylglycine-generating enzyme family protein [Leptospiraceae bacterium]